MAEHELDEKDFIPAESRRQPLFLWACLLAVLLLCFLAGGFETWTRQQMQESLSGKPFHNVTNREMSIFLWAYPEFMRVNQRAKSAYMPDFDYRERVGIKKGTAEQITVAPPGVLFRYHLWKRFLGDLVIWRPVPAKDLRDFIGENPEWHPRAWKRAPKEYRALVKRLDGMAEEEVVSLEDVQLPDLVQQALVGWKNYFFEGEEINQATFTRQELSNFLERYPSYGRQYWRNILAEVQPAYLLVDADLGSSEAVPQEQISAFLRIALFNDRQAKLGR